MQEVYSGKWGTDFASLLKRSTVDSKLGAMIGTVKSLTPLSIELIDGEVVINSSIHDIFVSSNLLIGYKRSFNSSGSMQINGTSRNYTMGNQVVELNTNIKVGDVLLVIPDETEQTFFVIEHMVKVGDI